MDRNIFPVDVISVCSAGGDIRPLRVRVEDQEHRLLKIDIDQIISVRQIQYVGIEAQVFLCRGVAWGSPMLFELQYTIRTHTWHMMRRIC